MSLFGTELRRLRRRSGLSQETLAGRAGLSPEAVSLLERGRRSPRLTTMRLLADAMRLTDQDRSALFRTAHVIEPTVPALPVFLDTLVGRAADLAGLDDLVNRAGTRLVTILGPAGVGKTRVAVEYARQHAADFADGLHWLPVGPLADRESFRAALAGAIGSRSTVDATLPELVAHLENRTLLLVIDDAEHLLPVCRELVAALLAGSPHSKVVITSRHLLELPGELRFVLPALRTPPLRARVDQLASYPASELFLTRSQRAGDLTAVDGAAVARICHRVDGLPLALELAAARTPVLTLPELADALETELGVLSTTDRGGTALVDAMVDTSYAALTPDQQLVFAQLAVFGSSFSREAVREVCGDGNLGELEVLGLMSALSARSLLERRDDDGPRARFRLLYLIKEYARSRLAAQPDVRSATEARHARHYARVVAAAAVAGDGDLAVADREVSNIRRAMTWALEHEPGLALRMVGALADWVVLRGRYTDGRVWATRALAAAPAAGTALRLPALQLAGSLAFLQCDYDEAQTMIEQARQLAVSADDRAGEVWATGRLGSIARERGDYDRAEDHHRRAQQLARAIGDEREVGRQTNFLSFLAWVRDRPEVADTLGQDALADLSRLGDEHGVVWALINLGTAARLRGRPDQSELLLTRALDLADELDFREGVAWARNQLGVTARCQHQLERARGLQLASLAEHTDLGDRWRAASVEDELAALAVERADHLEAAQHLSAADRLRRQIAAPVPLVERADRQRTETAARAALGSAYALAALSPRTPTRPPGPNA